MKVEFQEKRYSCKFCNKICFSGKSLGGHMRCHLALISAEKNAKKDDNKFMGFEFGDEPKKGLSNLMVSDQSNSSLEGFEVSGQITSYGLRDQPKKSWRVSDYPKHKALKKRNHCEKCGKGFQSLITLKIHMKCHLKKENEENVCKECGKVFDSMKALFGHMRTHSKRSRDWDESVKSQSDFEATAFPIRRKRSKIRYKIVPNPSFPNLNLSSLNIDGEEDMEVAMCLMMLSRGVRNLDGFNLVKGSSDYNSVVFEAPSFHNGMGISTIQGGNFLSNGDEAWKVKKPRDMLDPNLSCSAISLTNQNIAVSAEFGFGFSGIDEKKIELEVSVDGLSSGDMFKKPRHDDECAVELDDTHVEKGINIDQADSESMEFISSEKPGFDVHDLDLEGNSSGKMKCSSITDSEILKDSEKKNEYKCKTCDKIFHCHQALGGHRTHHKIISSSSVLNMESYDKSIRNSLLSDIESDSNQVEEEIGRVVAKSFESTKSKDYECPICFKVFASGQALGGHKRAHYNGIIEVKAKETLVIIQQEIPDISNIFDCNLCVTLEEGAKSDIGSDHKPEAEALVISK